MIRISDVVQCKNFPCTDIISLHFTVPPVTIDPERTNIFMISEAPPPDKNDYFYAHGNPFFLQTTLQAFQDAGIPCSSLQDILDQGFYITTAIKCAKKDYSVSAKTIETCSDLLEKEMEPFQHVKAFLLMGDVAIKAFNYIAQRTCGEKIIPRGSTYKIRKDTYSYNDARVFPSYLQTGKSFLIEKSKRKMIAEDIKAASQV
ncbi:MAG: uracil-DNA glycosylase family protein [Candidatus Methanofastidiosia archaeon]